MRIQWGWSLTYPHICGRHFFEGKANANLANYSPATKPIPKPAGPDFFGGWGGGIDGLQQDDGCEKWQLGSKLLFQSSKTKSLKADIRPSLTHLFNWYYFVLG